MGVYVCVWARSVFGREKWMLLLFFLVCFVECSGAASALRVVGTSLFVVCSLFVFCGGDVRFVSTPCLFAGEPPKFFSRITYPDLRSCRLFYRHVTGCTIRPATDRKRF